MMDAATWIRRSALGLSVVAVLGSAAAYADDSSAQQQGMQDPRHDRAERNADQRDIIKDKRALAADEKSGANSAQVAADKKALHADQLDRKRDRRGITQDQRAHRHRRPHP